MLSVLSYNIRYGKKLKKIVDWLSLLPTSFDILCFQEFPLEKVGYLLGSLTKVSYKHSFASGFFRNNKPYGQLTVINTDKIQLRNSKAISLGESSFIERKIFKTKGERSALITTLLYQNKAFILVNTYLICFALNKARIRQINTITAALSHDLLKTPTIILGDFNYSSLRKKGLLEFMKRYQFQDGTGKLPTHKLLMFTSLLTHQIDYVFYKSCMVKNATVMKKIKYSDHYPLRFTLELY